MFEFDPGTAYTGWLIGYADPTAPTRQFELLFPIYAQTVDVIY